ncbi:hypothetical protein ACFL6C_01600 [Myxococcota bacterium]
MKTRRLTPALVLAIAVMASSAHAQYTPSAGRSEPMMEKKVKVRDKRTGEMREQTVQVRPESDQYGNAQGNQFDLAVDGAFSGQTILIIDYYSNANAQDFSGPKVAVHTKGFSMVRYSTTPSPPELEKLLAKSNQFWLISSCDNSVHLTRKHHTIIREFFDAGHGVYLWGDNDPCNADANALAKLLVGAHVKGDVPGDTTVQISDGPGKPGVVRDHLLTTGVEHVYEGVTVATVKPSPNQPLTPIIWGSAGNLVTAAYERKAKRLIIDGGFTRLSYKWDTAGTARYIRNAAAWLANVERFGTQVTSAAAPTKK